MGKFDDEEEPPPHEFPPEAIAERPRAPVVGKINYSRLPWGLLEAKQPPERRWAIKGWLGFGHVTLLVGAGGIGKTLIAQQMSSSLSLGQNFIAEIPRAQRVLMWACEDDHDELWRRQINISQYLARPLSAFEDNFALVARHGLDNCLASSEFGKLQFTGLEKYLKEQVEDFKADVVVLDNVAQLYGGNENDRHAVTKFLNFLSGILDYRAILLLAHPSRGLNSEFSGSSAWENVARTRLYLGATLPKDANKAGDEDDDEADVRYLCRRKSNYSSRDWRRCVFKNGVLIPDDENAQGGIVGVLRASKAERVILDGLKKLAEMGEYASNAANSPRYLPRVLGQFKLSDGMAQTELGDAMRRLMVDGKIERGQVGKNANRTPVYGLLAKP